MNQMKNCLICRILQESKNFCIAFIRCFYYFMRRIITIARDHFYDKKLGVETSGYDNPGYFQASSDITLNEDMVAYGPTPYRGLKNLIDYLGLNQNDIFVDLGSGKGRVVFFVAIQRLKKVIGIEYDKKLVDIANENLKNLRLNNTPIEIIHTDAANFKIKDATVFFMFNPFGHKTIEKVIANIKESLINYPRKIRIIYYHPVYRFLFDSQEWLKLEEEMENGICLIWCNNLC